MMNVIVAPEVRDLASLACQLTAWLEHQLPEAVELKVLNLAYPHGAGQSHETILFEASWLAHGQPAEQGFVVRIKPTWHTVYPDDLFTAQFRLMQLLHDDGRVRVARPIWHEPDPALLGAPFFVMEKLKGKVAVSVPPYSDVGWVKDATPVQRARLWENGVRQLAAIQTVPRAEMDFLGGPPGARDGLAQEWDKYARFVDWVGQHGRWPVLHAALDRLRARWPANRPEGLVWGDARLGNMMFDDNFDVIAVMDWEQPSLGGALHDLAWWIVLGDRMHGPGSGRPPLQGMGSREETLALWREVTGISTDDIEWYEDFTELKICCLSIRTFALKGQSLPGNDALARRLKFL
ncbi:phosphotransferase family protein [Phenylobacterium sp. LjRoot225]|uniref:phosphotransferase family protein n=1 Tax=Phenylobacterium sp. LjRoot225 TaxID=3342285 RepID=UPI003ECF169F